MSSKGAAKVFRKDSAAPPTPKVAPAAASEASPTEHKMPGITTQEPADDASMGIGEYEASVADMTMNDLQEDFSCFVLDQPDIMRAAAGLQPLSIHRPRRRVAEKNSHFERPFQPTADVKQLVSFDQIKAPTLHRPDLAEMKAFWLKYDKYERDLREKYEQYGQHFAIQYRHVRNCMESYVFNTICRYRWKRDPAEITHADVYALFKIDCTGSHAEIPAFLERLKRELRIDETMMPHREKLQFSEKRYARWADFVDLLIDCMGSYCTYEAAIKAQLQATHQHDGRDRHGKKQQKHVPGAAKPEASLASPTTAAPTTTKSKHPCLKCGDEYHLQLLDDWKKGQAANNTTPPPAPRASTITTTDPSTTPGFLLATIDGSHGYPIRTTLDSGADVTVVARSWVTRALEARCVFDVRPLPEPIKTLAFNGAEVVIKEYVALDVSLPIAAGGTLLLRQLPCLVQDDELPAGSSDLLVSRNVMATLGFTPSSVLEKAGQVKRVWDFEPHVDTATGKLRIGALYVPSTTTAGTTVLKCRGGAR
ncbi:hypothetical protein ACHHYP_15812 [Achlya hypogyna]|uniref:Peptidase A2 domain-containing protein n=1 Tax=Achlya hypogyna TaxID=1202772 RepID=A0A1V9ZEV6_ACHHY|nr:hypothetical protein ACHHYP_15812 [Achlya hypogyna]